MRIRQQIEDLNQRYGRTEDEGVWWGRLVPGSRFEKFYVDMIDRMGQISCNSIIHCSNSLITRHHSPHFTPFSLHCAAVVGSSLLECDVGVLTWVFRRFTRSHCVVLVYSDSVSSAGQVHDFI